jgi:hypothetical protein
VTNGEVDALIDGYVKVTPKNLTGDYDVQAPFILTWGHAPSTKAGITVALKSENGTPGLPDDGYNAFLCPMPEKDNPPPTILVPLPVNIGGKWYSAKEVNVTEKLGNENPEVEVEYEAIGGDHPFKVLQKEEGGEGQKTYKYGVVYESSLYKSLKPDDKQTIEGLLSEDHTTGWATVTAPGHIWLGVTFDNDGNVTWAGIDNSDTDDFDLTQNAWSGQDGYVEDNGETSGTNARKHQTSRKLIAKIVAGKNEGDPPKVEQLMFSHQILQWVAISGRAATYPYPI